MVKLSNCYISKLFQSLLVYDGKKRSNIDLQLGFTLLELMVSITILAILAVVGMASFTGTFAKARDGKAISDIKTISKALEMYYSINGSYPGLLKGLTEVGDNVKTKDQFIKGGNVPIDKATDEPYLYYGDSESYCLCTHEIEHESKSGSNATGVNESSFACSYTSVTDGEGTHFCVENAQ